MSLKTNRKCQEHNRDTGYKYLDLGKQVKKLVEKYDVHIKNNDNELGWDFEGLRDTYTEIERRLTSIGNRLLTYK